MKIAVVGAGIFGVTTALKLAKNGHKVNLYEKNSDILSAASGINQYRLHRGYHYPRSKATALSSKFSENSFRKEYGKAVVDSNMHFYCVAKDGSKISGEEFLQFCKECDLEHEIVDIEHMRGQMVDIAIRVKESIIDPIKLKEICLKKLNKERVKIVLDTTFVSKDVDNYDLVINCTYANSNFILENFPEAKKEYQFELCEKPVLKLSKGLAGTSIVVMDGPFFCIDPYGNTGLHVMGNVVHALHASNTGYYPIIPTEYLSLLNKGVVKNPSISNIAKFLESASRFIPIIKNAEHVGSMFTIRTVLPNVDRTDERPTIVTRVNEKVINVFSGKIGNCVDAAQEVLKLVEAV